MGALAERVRASVSLSWRWFGYWRRRYVWLRLGIIALVFALPVYEVFRPVTRDLVVIAIDGIESAKRGPYFEVRAIQFQQKKQLQKTLLAAFDRNGDGRLDRAESRNLSRRTDLTRGQVAGSALHVELDPLVEANHRLGLLSLSRTARDMRREALTAALAEREREHDDLWREAGEELVVQYAGPADYLKWATWKRGLDRGRDVLAMCLTPRVSRLFAGVTPRYYQEMWGEPPAKWMGAVGWLVLLGLAGLAIRRYGKGAELARRFREEPELGAAPCPVCGASTQDYGSLPHHRASRAWATAAVVALALLTLSALVSAQQWRAASLGQLTRLPMGTFLEGSAPRLLTDLAVGALLVLAAGVVRWVLWPREVHASHRRPLLRVVGFAVGVVLVVGLLSMMAAGTMRTLEGPRRPILVAAGRHQRRASAPGRGHRRHAKVRAAPSEAKPAAKPARRGPARRGPARGAAALERSAKRLRSGEGRRRRGERRERSGRASRRVSRDRGREESHRDEMPGR
ncbi:MAG TPA: hypothetical protein VMY87_10830 [Armatimonadota bacterium]|nr:hypothetical protein [Armatimonadota bacterium]